MFSDYRIVEAMTQKGLKTECDKLMAEGYVPLGGVARDRAFYYQSFAKK